MAAFLLTSPSAMANSRRRSGGGIGGSGGGMSMENVAEEVLDVMFCHYEPPTSERAQLRAAQLARSDPAKYGIRKATKPILKIPSVAERRGITTTTTNNNNNNNNNGSTENNTASCGNAVGESILFKLARDITTGTSSATAKDNSNTDDATTMSTTVTKKSVTWRDEQSKTKRSSTEQNAAGCTAYHCGFFKQGEGLVDILMSPSNRNKKASSNGAAASGPPVPVLKKITADAASPSATMTSAGTNGTGISSPANTIATSVATSTTSMKSGDGNSTTASGDHPSSARVLYDDLGNPIREGHEDEDDQSAMSQTPTSQQHEMTVKKISRNGGDASSGGSMSDSFSSFFAAPIAVAASMMGGGKTTDGSNTNLSDSATASDRLGVYEPEDYDQPGTYRELQLPYREARSPTPLKRIPTPRYDHTNGFGAEEQSDDGESVQQTQGKTSPGRLNRQTTPFLRDEEPDCSALAEGSMNIRIPGSESNTPRKTFPSGRSDVYSDITEDELTYLQKRGATPVEADDDFLYFYDDKGDLLARRRPQSIRSDSKRKLTTEEEGKIFYHTPVASKAPKQKVVTEQKDAPDVAEDDEKEERGGGEQLTPREFFKRLDEANRRKRADEERDFQSSTLKVATKKEPVATKKGSVQYEVRQEEAECARDPTPRSSSAPKDDRLKSSSENLPPTPRRDSGGTLPPTPRREDVEKESRELNLVRSRRSSFAKSTTPRSMANTMATDDEIREEVSSVGVMTPSTLRLVQKNSNQSSLPDGIPKVLPVPERKARTEPNASEVTSRSTLTSHPSKASHRGEKSKRSSKKKVKTRSKSSDQSHRSKSSNRSGSTTQSKNGWFGRVKQVVNDFEEERLPLPAHLRRARSQERQRSTKTKGRR